MITRVLHDLTRSRLGRKVTALGAPFVPLSSSEMETIPVVVATRSSFEASVRAAAASMSARFPNIVEFTVRCQGITRPEFFVVNTEGFDTPRYIGRVHPVDGELLALREPMAEF